MTITEMLDKVQYTTDEQGNKVVLVDLETWQQFEAILRGTEASGWTEEDEADEKRWDELFSKHPEVLERLAQEARADRAAGRTSELDPDTL
jgi:hypothetical protein